MSTGTPLLSTHSPISSYDNNNEANAHKMKQQHLRSASSAGSTTGSTGGSHPGPTVPPRQSSNQSSSNHNANAESRRRRSERRNEPYRGTACARVHLNSLWSVWYGFFGTFMQAYIAVKCTKRFLRYSVLPWTNLQAVWELHTCFLITAGSVMLLPVFLAAAIFKIGNYANDGYKIGRGVRSVGGMGAEFFLGTGSCNSFWRHAGPTAAFLHLVIAFGMLIPKLVMEARLVEYGFLPSDALWRTDLDFMVVHHDRLVVLSFMTAASPGNVNITSPSSSIGGTTTPQGMMDSAITAAALVVNSSLVNHQEATTGSRSIAFQILDYLQEFFKMDTDNDLDLDAHVDSGFGSSVSVEFMNYALALLVYSVRYPAVFWHTNKCFGIIFSLQLLVNSIQSLLSFAGMSVLYKVQIVGAWKALPLLRHYPEGVSPLGGHAPFLLNPHVTLALFALSNILILASSLILYLYGHGRFHAFLNQHREKQRHIFANTNNPQQSNNSCYEADSPSWGYLTHCAALCALVATAVTNAPLLHDYTVVYRGSLDGAVLACVIAAIGHLFLWVLVWLFLTIKHKWTFKIKITVGRATVRSARSVRLITDIELASRRQATQMNAANRRRRHDDDEHPNRNATNSGSNNDICANQPLLVVGNGRAYTVSETTSRKAIMSVVQKAATAERSRDEGKIMQPAVPGGSSSNSGGGSETADEENDEQIYWLRPAVVTPHHSPDSASEDRLCWFSNKKQSSQHGKHKVTFNEATSTSNIRNNKNGIIKTKLRGPGGNGGPDEDDGDYATLREIPMLPPMLPDPEDDTTSEEGKLLACVHDDNVTYASTSRDLIPPADYEDPSPLLTPEPLSDREEPSSSVKTNPVNITVHNNHTQIPTALTPRCLRRADSGMPHEELTPRSDSISTESSQSQSPPDPPGSNHSETSSGVHSNASSEQPGQHQIQVQSQINQIENHQHQILSQSVSRRATSVADLVQQKEENQWKSSSLQRNIQPPNPIYGYTTSTNGSVIGYSAPYTPPGNTVQIEPTVQTIVVQRNAQTLVNPGHPGHPGKIYGYSSSAGVVTTDGIETVVVRPGSSNQQTIYGYTNGNKQPTPPVQQQQQQQQQQITSPQSIYGYTKAPVVAEVVTEHGGIPAVILENSAENTVVIRRKTVKPSVIDNQQIPVITEEPFGRSTNMRMTSFTEHNDLKNIQASSATLPHYPTQPIPAPAPYPHCSTMPLPHNSQNSVPPSTNLGAGNSCNVYPRQHTTIPTHHNGVRLFPANAQSNGQSNGQNHGQNHVQSHIQNPYVKRVQNYQNGGVRLNGAEGIYGSSNGKGPAEMYHFNS